MLSKRPWVRFGVAAALLFGTALVGAHPAAATGISACTIAGAPSIPLGVAVAWNSDACDAGQGWAQLYLNAGDIVQFDAQSPDGASISVYTPNATDFNWTTKEVDALGCGDGGYAFWQMRCQVTGSGNWRFMMHWHGSLTASVTRAMPQAGRIQGSCTIAGAPVSRDRVTQYGHAGCRAQHSIVFWKTAIYAGDQVSFLLKGVEGWGNVSSVELALWRPSTTDFTLYSGNNYYGCADSAYYGSPQKMDCGTLTKAGWYYVGLEGQGSFTAVITHAVRAAVAEPAKLKRKKLTAIRVRLSSPAGAPRGACVIQRSTAGRWKSVGRAGVVVAGACAPQVKIANKGTVTLRVKVAGASGWASLKSPKFRVKVK